MNRRLESVFAFFVLLFFAFFFFTTGRAETKPETKTSPCAVAQEKIVIPIHSPFQSDQVRFKAEMRDLLTDILRDDAKGVLDIQKYHRLKELVKKIKVK